MLAFALACVLFAPVQRSILVFSKTAGFRHDSIPVAREALLEVGKERHWNVVETEDSAFFEPTRLKAFDTVVFLLTTGDVLNTEQESALTDFVSKGGGYVGVHSAADTEYDWSWYGQTVGAYFLSHPAIQDAVVKMEDTKHPSTRFLPNPWKRNDEWYDYRSSPRGKVHVLSSLDPNSYTGSKMPGDHPITWCQDLKGGRSWYTGMGHTSESYQDPLFMRMLAEAIEWASAKSKRHREPVSEDNTLSSLEKRDGWKLLFDGKTLNGWHNFKEIGIRSGWQAKDGVLTIADPENAGDIVTNESYGWFELSLDFRLDPGQNSGVMYHVTDAGSTIWTSGPEIQLYDHPAEPGVEITGYLYELYSSVVDASRPSGQWNHLRVVVTPEKCETDVNGVKYYEYVLNSPDFKARTAKSKFAAYPEFSASLTGGIGLQGDHGKVSFKNIKIRRL